MTRDPIHGESVATWEQDDNGEWVMESHDVEVAHVNGQAYTVPSVCSGVVREPKVSRGDSPPRYFVSAEVGVANGQPHFRGATVQADHPLSPQDMQRIPWRLVAESVVVMNSAETADERTGVLRARRRSSAATAARKHREENRPPRRRKQHTDAFLLDILKRKAKAQANAATPRYDIALGAQLGYSANHVRKLVTEALRRGLEVSAE